MKEKLHYVTVGTTPDEQEINGQVLGKSIFLESALRLNLARAVAQLDPSARKSSELSGMWKDLRPKAGYFTFEMATELPYFLPNLEGKGEYIISTDNNQFIVCNRMVRAFYAEEPEDPGLLPEDAGDGSIPDERLNYFLVHRLGLNSLKDKISNLESLHPVPIATFISCQNRYKASSAEEALENEFIAEMKKFAIEINAIIDAFRSIDSGVPNLLPHLALSRYPIIWVAVRGDGEAIGCEQFIWNVWNSSIRSMANVAGTEVSKLKKILQKESTIPAHEYSLGLAETFLHYGLYEQSAIQISVACETILSEKLRQHLESRGLSKSKLKEYLKDVRYSNLLNIHLATMCEIKAIKNYRNVMESLNRIRSIRNDSVHAMQERKSIKQVEIQDGIKAAKELISELNSCC